MRITELQLNRILDRYIRSKYPTPGAESIDVLKVRFSTAFINAIEFVEANTKADILNLAAIGAEDEATFSMQTAQYTLLTSFLNSVLQDPLTGDITFNADIAPAVKAAILDRKLSVSDQVYIYDEPRNWSIREKYTRGRLTGTHWLTDLDLQRMLKITGTESKVTILPFTAENIGTSLHFARQAHQGENASYTVGFLLNLGSEHDDQGSHWVAAKVTIDPVSNQITYQIDDSLPISAAQRAEYKRKIEEGIRYNEPPFEAYSAVVSITAVDSGIAPIQTDGYSCGYRALHCLLQDQSISGNNPKAHAFAQVELADSQNLVRAFYEYQLSDLSIPRDMFEMFNQTTRSVFVKPVVAGATSVKIETSKLASFIRELPAVIPARSRPSIAEGAVSRFIGAGIPGKDFLRFPDNRDTSLDAVQYETLFQELSELIKPPLPAFMLSYCNTDALDGVINFFAETPLNLFRKLTLNIDLDAGASEETIDIFVAKLKLALMNLSRTDLNQLVIADDNNVLQERHIQELVALVEARQINIAIELPIKFQTTDAQRRLDTVFATTQREKSRELLGSKPLKADLTSVAKKKGAIRKRERIDLKAAMKIDIELQEGVDETVTMGRVQEQLAEVQVTDYSQITILRLRQLQRVLKDSAESDDLSVFQGPAAGLTKKGLETFWHLVFGNTILSVNDVTVNNDLGGISDAALAHLIEYKPYFQTGINRRELPQGFLLITDPDDPLKRVLHFDTNLEPHETMAPTLLAPAPKAILNIDFVTRLLSGEPAEKLYVKVWNKIQSSTGYSRDGSKLFRQHLLDLMRLSDEQLAIVVRLSGGEEAFDVQKLDFMMRNLDKAKASYMGEQYNEDALVCNDWLVSQFSELADRKAYINLAHSIAPKAATEHPLLSLLERDHLGALKANVASAISTYTLTDVQLNALLPLYDKYGTTGLEKILTAWSAISALPNVTPNLVRSIQAHVSGYEALLLNNDMVDTAKIISGFLPIERQWWEKLYSAHQPIDDNLSNLVNSFTTFSRALTERGLSFYDLTEHKHTFTGAGNLPTTLGRMLSILNLCNDDDRDVQWKAMSQIDLSAQGALRQMTEGLDTDEACSFVVPEMAGSEKRTKKFYNDIAKQKDHLPLSFYQEALSALDALRSNDTLSEYAVYWLSNFLVHTTTGDNCRYFIPDVTSAKAQWQSVVDNLTISNLPLQPLNRQAQDSLVIELSSLGSLPALPILQKVVALVSAPIRETTTFLGLASLEAKMQPLKASFVLLKPFVESFGSKIYQGMKFYDKSDFSKKFQGGRDLFAEHLAVSKKLQDLAVAEELLPFISTFKIDTTNAAQLAERINGIKKTAPPKTAANGGIPASSAESADAGGAEKEKQEKLISSILLPYALGFLLEIESVKGLDANAMQGFLDSLTEKITTESKRFSERYDLVLAKTIFSPEDREILHINAILISMTGNDTPPDMREDAIKDIQKFAKAVILEEVERSFKPNFPAGYFDKLKAGKPQGKIQLIIDKKFKDKTLRGLIEVIQAKFSTESSEKVSALIHSIASICDKISATEKVGLLLVLKDERFLNAPIDHYIKLLETINQSGSASFMYFMQAARKVGATDDLTIKATYFLSTALPQIRSKPTASFREIDVVGLVADLVLAAKEDEITTAVNLKPELTEIYSRLLTALKGKSPVVIDSALADLIQRFSNMAELESIQALQAALVEVKRQEFTEEIVQEAVTVEETVYKKVIVEPEHFFGRLIRLVGASKPQTKSVADRIETREISPAVTRTVEKIKTLDDALLKKVTEVLASGKADLESYTFAFVQTFSLIDNLIATYPAAKALILAFNRHYLSFNDRDSEQQVKQAFDNLHLIHNELVALADQDLVISLCEYFGEPGQDGNVFSYKELLALFQGKKPSLGSTEGSIEINFEKYPLLEPAAKKQVLKVVSSLLNNKKPCSLQDIERLINLCSDEAYGATHIAVLEDVFKGAPFPTLDLIERWLTEAKQEASTSTETPPNAGNVDARIKESVVGKYITWNITPVARESVNVFVLNHARRQAAAMQGIDYIDAELVAIDSEVKRARNLTTKDLLQEISEIKQTPGDHSTQLVALMAELLYRTKGLPQLRKGNGSREWGRSFEINTTQYLAIHSMLKTGGHVTSQIGTGEGKSRIMMISIACQYALGNTVDFVTSDLSLATRDYLEYQSFFKILGAHTNIINAQTPANQYRVDGINFSDASSLSLFRNKARSEGNEALVITGDPSKRCLMLDEADKTYFDTADTRFNYSAQADASIRDIPWIYELMMAFFSVKANVDLYYDDADACNEAFYNFASGRLDASQKARLIHNPEIPGPLITRNQLEAWQSSALTAHQLIANTDYIIKPNVTIQTKEGPTICSQAQLVSGNRVSGNAKFSFGVHQCLHAGLNLMRASGDKSTPLGAYLATLEVPFYIDSENQIVYSTTSKALLDDYAEGGLLAVTGTAGSIKEQEEAKVFFGRQAGDTKHEMSFIDIPRHRGLSRVDFPVSLTKNARAHQQKIVEAIRDSLRKKQPILLVCEDDNASEALHRFLESTLTEREKRGLKRISAHTEIHEEASYVKSDAGKPGAITVTTGMLGRGTDIKLHGKAEKAGLNVIGTYLPRERDYWQFVGRAGRFGDKGQSRLILDGDKLKTQLGVTALPIAAYTATEAYLASQQKRMDSNAQQQRVIKNAVGDFRLALTSSFFDKFYKPLYKNAANKDLLLAQWQLFFDKTDKAWNDAWPKIADKLAQAPVNKAHINALLIDYRGMVLAQWIAMRDQLHALVENGKLVGVSQAMIDEQLPKDIGTIALGVTAQGFVTSGKQASAPDPMRTIIAKKYDPAYVGRAVIYTNFFDSIYAFFENIKAARRGDGPWFPNLQAARNGHMRWTQFFFGTWGVPLASPHPDDNQSDVVHLNIDQLLYDEQGDDVVKMDLADMLRPHSSDEAIAAGLSKRPVSAARRQSTEQHSEPAAGTVSPSGSLTPGIIAPESGSIDEEPQSSSDLPTPGRSGPTCRGH